jgi:hypothetical protein
LECGEDRRFGSFCSEIKPKAAMLAALQMKPAVSETFENMPPAV